jgi:putative transposase
MSRPKRNFQPNFCYHITTRCNNREFRLTRFECREVLLYAIKKAQEKYGFKLYALCIMSNHSPFGEVKSQKSKLKNNT